MLLFMLTVRWVHGLITEQAYGQNDHKETQNDAAASFVMVSFSLGVLLLCGRMEGPFACLCPGPRCLKIHLWLANLSKCSVLQHTVALNFVWPFFFFGEKWWQISEPHFSVCVSGHHKSESFIDMIPHEIIYIQYDNDRWAPLFNLCSLFPLSARLGRVLCVSLQMCLVQITL